MINKLFFIFCLLLFYGLFDLVQFGESCADERRYIVVFHQIVLLQHEQILPCLEILAAAAVDIAQEHQCARQPVLLLGVHLGKLHRPPW